MHARRRALARLAILGSTLIAAVAVTSGVPAAGAADNAGNTTTPIKHLVVIFQENVSFDHYFATYPNATNPAGEPRFVAKPGTPSVNGLNDGLLTHNPNSAPPLRLDRSQAHTCDQGHDYTQEQLAFDHGLLDRFPETVGNGSAGCDKNQVMNYYDGNTVTALWNYAQGFAMSDNSYTTNFGPSTVGALNLVAGQTFGAACTSTEVYCGVNGGTVTADPQPTGDKCTNRDNTTMTQGRNVGDLMNTKQVTWGFFQGGFTDLTCKQSHTAVGSTPKGDYIPHHQPFQYYASTANPNHTPPTSAAMVGKQGDAGNHQYDLTDYWAAVKAGNMPNVNFIKAAGYEDGHAGYSTPLDEQFFVVNFINALEKTKFWKDTAVVIAYDDTDGWYDHVMSPILMQSQTARDALTAPGQCGSNPLNVPMGSTGPQQARCGYGGRAPLLLVSPFARTNFVDGTTTDQSSILRFIEDNWQLGRIGNGSSDAFAGTLNRMFSFRGSADEGSAGKLFLDPCTGQRTGSARNLDPTGYTATYTNTCLAPAPPQGDGQNH
jgi:phospholipase C